ncbi:hypothetical protein [Pedobacter sp. SYP-B3415]|uniref:hypothetical protein n=1 Tax=Pedobacter sp. SYP-B3415 TaxID=2496641 RepID=UPI00101CA15D|nr:hypothetical protein [Pedobacter sp. SYP-B3415]
MNWTGELYGFYTNKTAAVIFEKMKKSALELGYQYEYTDSGFDEVLFFYRDQAMLDHHLEHGYNTDPNGKGCFSLEAKVVRLDAIASLHELEGAADFEPYDINLAFNEVTYIVLVLPDFVENSAFAAEIHALFKSLLLT